MDARLAGSSLIAFGSVILIGSLVAAYFLDARTIDVLAIIVVFVGGNVRKGSPRAAKWALGIMAYYLLIGGALLVGTAVAPDSLRIGDRPLRPGEEGWVIATGCVVVAWALLNIALLANLLRGRRAPLAERAG